MTRYLNDSATSAVSIDGAKAEWYAIEEGCRACISHECGEGGSMVVVMVVYLVSRRRRAINTLLQQSVSDGPTIARASVNR